MPETPLLPELSSSLESGEAALQALLKSLATGLADAPESWQLEGFRLTRAFAQIHAARASLQAAGNLPQAATLPLAFGGEVLQHLREVLPWLALQFPAASASVARFVNDPKIQSLTRTLTSEAFYRSALERLPQIGSDASGLDEEYRLLRGTFRDFAERKVRPLAEAWHREDLLIPDALIAQAAELGCFGLSIPAEFGGVRDEPDNLGMVVVTEELSRGALIFGSLITRPEILAKALLRGGTEAQKRRWLPRMASGEVMVGVAITEPDAGSDVARLKVTAQPTPDGWRINGTKVWSTFSGRADLLMLLARTEPEAARGHKGLSLFVLEKPAFHGHTFEHRQEQGGTLTGRAISTLGYRGMHSFELNFEDYRVPADGLVGGVEGRGRGFYLQMESFSYGRLQTAGRALGVMQAALEQALSYADARRVFGQPLSGFPLTAAKLVRMAATVHACRMATYAAAHRLNQGAGQMEASLVKLLACNHAEWITREAQQIHGGMGYAEEFAVSRLFLDARVLSIFEGTEEVLALKVVLPALLRGGRE